MLTLGGEGVFRQDTLSVAFGASSPRGRAKSTTNQNLLPCGESQHEREEMGHILIKMLKYAQGKLKSIQIFALCNQFVIDIMVKM